VTARAAIAPTRGTLRHQPRPRRLQ